MEKVLEIPAKEIYEHEFSVYAALEFSLLLPKWEVMPHLERILSAEGKEVMRFGRRLSFSLSY